MPASSAYAIRDAHDGTRRLAERMRVGHPWRRATPPAGILRRVAP